MGTDGPALVHPAPYFPNFSEPKTAEPELNQEYQLTNHLVLRLVPVYPYLDSQFHLTAGASDKILLYEKPCFRLKREAEKASVSEISDQDFSHMLKTFRELVQIQNPSEQVLYSIKLTCKKFWSSIHIEGLMQSLKVVVLDKWMSLFLTLLEGQPSEIEGINQKQWLKVKEWILKILNHLFTRFAINTRTYDKALAKMFEYKYGGKILDCCLKMLKAHVKCRDLPDKLLIQSLEYLTNSLLRVYMYELLKKELSTVLYDIIFPLLFFNDKDKKLWKDQFQYVKSTVHSPKTAGIKFLNLIFRKHSEDSFDPFVMFIIKQFESYKSLKKPKSRQKNGALLAFGTLSDRLKSIYDNWEIRDRLSWYVISEITSCVGHLRAQAVWVAGKYAYAITRDSEMLGAVVKAVIGRMKDKQYAVRVNSVIALQSLIVECDCVYNRFRTIGLDLFRPQLENLIKDVFTVMDQDVNTDLVFAIETIVDRFAVDDIAPFALLLCQNLASAFWKYFKITNDDVCEEVYDQAISATLCCLRCILRTLEASSNSHSIFADFEPILLPIINQMLTTKGGEMYEEVLQIVSYMLAFPMYVSDDMWNLWPLIADAPILWVTEFFSVISYILQNYILKDTQRFLSSKEPDYQQSLWNIISTIMGGKEWKDGYIEPAAKLMETVFQNCKWKVDYWLEPYIQITIVRLQRTESPSLKCLLLLVISDALYYNASSTLKILQKLGYVASEIFYLWRQMLQETKKNGRRANFRREEEKLVCCLGLTSLLSLPVDQLPGGDILEHIYKANLDILVAYKDQVLENAKKSEDRENVGARYSGDIENSDESSNESAEAEVAEPEFDFFDYYRLDSPIDEVDPFILFDDTLKGMEALKLENLRLTLDNSFLSLADCLAQYTEERRLSYST